MHTNDAPMAAARLIDMGVEPFLIASGLECVVAQRLARRLCQDCRRPVGLSAREMEANGFPIGDVEAYEPVGCVRCGDTGYRGRVGIYEVMALDEELNRRSCGRLRATRSPRRRLPAACAACARTG